MPALIMMQKPINRAKYVAGGDVTAPTVSSATINTAGTQLTLNLSETCVNGAGGSGGLTITPSGGAATLTYLSGSGSSAFIYTISRTILQSETVTRTYVQPGNGIEDSAGNDLASFTTQAVTNNSTQTGGAATDLVTLDAGNSGSPGYRYWDINASGFSSTTYRGAFKLPSTENTGTDVDFFYSLPALAVTSSTKMLVSGHSQGDSNKRIAEVNIPTLSTSSSLASLNRATYSTAFFSPVDGAPVAATTWGNGPKILGMKAYNGRVMVQVYPYYDGSGVADKSICVLNSASAPSTTSERGFFAGTGGGAGVAHSSVWCSEIPAADKSDFGGTHVMGASNGNAYRSIEGRNSMGPTLFTYDADQTNSITGSSPVSNGSSITYTRKMDFDPTHVLNSSTLGSAGQQWDHCSEPCYGFLVPNTDTYMVIGFDEGVETGSQYYDPNDPWGGGKGYGPNTQSDVWNRYWLFKKSEILAASQVYSPVAYETGRLIMPFEGTKLRGQQHRLIGADFDLSTNYLWFGLEGAEVVGIPGSLPVIGCFDFSTLVA